MVSAKSNVKISYDKNGTPGVWADSVSDAYHGLGLVQARLRPLQALILAAASRGELGSRLAPRSEALMIDALVQRLDIPRRAALEAQRLDTQTCLWLDAFLQGFARGLENHGRPWEMRALLAKLPQLGRAEALGGLMLSAYLGLAEGQENMERALVGCLQAGGSAATLVDMFWPHLEGWDPAALERADPHVSLGFTAQGLRVAGGSNAWAISKRRAAKGHAMLCGDPHLQMNQLPSLFLEVRVRIGQEYWLGASIPGMPGIAVGRNRRVAWSGTFACADNVDMTLWDASTSAAPRQRPVVLRRRGRRPLRHVFLESDFGVLQTSQPKRDRPTMAVQWAGLERTGEALSAYMKLPLAQSAPEAAALLHDAHTLSLHWILADCDDNLIYKQAGRIPRRTHGWSGLYPVPEGGERRWDGRYVGSALPQCGPEDDMVVSANEARAAPDGGVLATLAQPPYRQRRIVELLAAHRRHDVASMQALQQDVLSLQGLTLRPWLLAALPESPLKEALQAWDGNCDVDSVGAQAFFVAYRAAARGLAPLLGGNWWHQMLTESEISVWWCRGIDRLLQSADTWEGPCGAALHRAVRACVHSPLPPWGNNRSVTLQHIVFGDLPKAFGLNRGPYPLQGSIGTVCQGNLVPGSMGVVPVGPAYRMVCDLGEEGIHTAMPGGIDGSVFSASYDRWVRPFFAGEYHYLGMPTDDEPTMD